MLSSLYKVSLQITIKLPTEGHEHQNPRHCQKRSGPELSAALAVPGGSPGLGKGRPCSPRPAVWAHTAPELGRASGSALQGGSGHGRPEPATRANTAWTLVSAKCGERSHGCVQPT